MVGNVRRNILSPLQRRKELRRHQRLRLRKFIVKTVNLGGRGALECFCKKNNVFRSLVLVSQFGISMLVPILFCTLIGAYIGERFSIPIITVPLFIIGALAGIRNVYIMAKKTYEDKEDSNAKKN